MSRLNAIAGFLLTMVLMDFPDIMQAAERKPPSDAAKIANAMTAAPPAISHNASVAEMNEGGSMKVLRKGSNEWT